MPDNPKSALDLMEPAKLPLSILTDLEEFAVHDCRVRPNKSDRASTTRKGHTYQLRRRTLRLIAVYGEALSFVASCVNPVERQ